MSQSATYLGKGWSFPPEFDKKNGTVKITSAIVDIERSLRIIVTTKTGERVMRPKFGCDLSDKVFENLNSTQINSIKKRIEEAIILYEPRIEVKSVDLDISNLLEGKLLIRVTYIVRATNTRRNIVFPYYKIEATDI